ncbi:putative polysaccharide biosynthesis protein [Gordonia polyisoprenivorans VH2]|uniref:Putative polysaccharide biosynthesis protein n=2 Tax=Gordonia polyisoprenivorans TaxID=84595 RepID=H6N1M4_GORPV|nr:putative polysaccharide biosynthesis protein [Gordonia polyisoprenivorans VH2]QUD85159.1 oligosaccharide flippase family protein [Gordonia polyisoprenivorans]
MIGRLATRDRLTVNASALMASSVGTGLLGLVYWIVAEHHFPTAEVGRASAVISSATVLSSLACLSLGGAFQRFLPVAGGAALRYIVGGYLLTAATGVVLATGFVVVGLGDRILHSTGERIAFVAMVVVFALYALTDPILTGLRRAPAVAVKNITLSAIKIVPIVVLAGVPSALAISGSWALLAAVVTAVFVFGVCRTASARRGQRRDLPAGRELLSFQGAFFFLMLVSSVTPLALPLVVVAKTDTTQNAYFNLAWTMCSAAGMLRASIGSAFIVEASAPDADRPALLRRLGTMLGLVTGVVAAGLAIGGPVVLLLAGRDYFHAAGPLMVVMAVESIVETVVVTYFLIAQLQRRMRLMVAAQVIMVITTVGGAWVLLDPLGLLGVAVASLLAVVITLAVVARPLILGVRAMLHDTPANTPHTECTDDPPVAGPGGSGAGVTDVGQPTSPR